MIEYSTKVGNRSEDLLPIFLKFKEKKERIQFKYILSFLANFILCQLLLYNFSESRDLTKIESMALITLLVVIAPFVLSFIYALVLVILNRNKFIKECNKNGIKGSRRRSYYSRILMNIQNVLT